MFDWEVAKESDWLTVTPGKGTKSEDAVTLSVIIDRNVTNSQRDDVITVRPLPTEFYPGVTINPKDAGIYPISIPVKQYGGQKPAISVPWVSDGIKQDEATLTFNYYSPYVAIDGAGLQWKMAGEPETSWNSVPVSITDSKSGTVTVTLTGLQPFKKYEARGYVMVGAEIQPGSATEEFTTAGRYPNSDDNPTPSR